MTMNKLDYFKISIIVILLGFLIVFYRYSENGRYAHTNNDSTIIIDTRTGELYRVQGGGHLYKLTRPVKED
jgi:hypothetical protein